MKRLLAALVVILAVAGCADYHASVTSTGGDSVTVDGTGTISARGTVVNTGDGKAEGVVLHFSFTQAGVVYLRQNLLLGDIPSGGTRTFNATFTGPVVDPALFGWSYTVDWE